MECPVHPLVSVTVANAFHQQWLGFGEGWGGKWRCAASSGAITPSKMGVFHGGARPWPSKGQAPVCPVRGRQGGRPLNHAVAGGGGDRRHAHGGLGGSGIRGKGNDRRYAGCGVLHHPAAMFALRLALKRRLRNGTERGKGTVRRGAPEMWGRSGQEASGAE